LVVDRRATEATSDAPTLRLLDADDAITAGIAPGGRGWSLQPST